MKSFTIAMEHEAVTRAGEEVLRIKVSVDGAKMSRRSNFVIMTYGVLNDEETVMSAAGNHVIAVVNGPKSYDTLKTAFSTLFAEIDSVIRSNGVEVNGKHHPISIVLGGDMKFLNMAMGLSSATANHACVWCKVHKAQRHDSTASADLFNSPPVARTL
eukprot:scpid94204/ scgid34412/ 